MNALIAYSINKNNFVLSPERTLFWEKQKTLIIADLHISKSGSFRKPGIWVPERILKEDLQRLVSKILAFKAEQLIILGGLSQGRSNKELEFFKKWRTDFSLLNILVVTGNHDITETAWYDELNIARNKNLQIDKFSFCHNPEDISVDSLKAGRYIFCGYLHPGISIKGRGKKYLEFPCFYFRNLYAVLPSFSRYTDLTTIEPKKNEHVFAITENGLLPVR
jgi:DNA ligase-associated metallophosphoesterase